MTGPEHYREAAELLDYVENGAYAEGVSLSAEEQAATLARAQIHATLAHAAAAALPTVTHYMGDTPTVTAWGAATTEEVDL